MKSKRDLAYYLADRLLSLELLDDGNFGCYDDQLLEVQKEIMEVLEDYVVVLGRVLD